MLPKHYLLCQPEGAHSRPAWLEPRHDAWLRTVIEAFDGCAGRPAGELSRRAQALAVDARRKGLSLAAVLGVWHVLRQGSKTVVEAPVSPRDLREEMFALATTMPIEQVFQQFSGRLGAPAEHLRAWLYADLPAARILRTRDLPSPSDLRDRYNLSLAQGLVGRCTRVEIDVEENLRAVVRAAKLRGLLVSVDGRRPRIEASGPLALFRQTTKYARALASFIPALVSMPSWSLEGNLHLGSDGASAARLKIDARAPLPRTWKLPARADSALEASLMKALRRSGSEWTLQREAIVLRAGKELFFPDFVLTRDEERVVVEIVGFWTPDYLQRKLSQLATVTDLPLVVCVDDGLACDASQLPQADIVRFRRRLDPAVLLAAAERAIQVWRTRMQVPITSM